MTSFGVVPIFYVVEHKLAKLYKYYIKNYCKLMHLFLTMHNYYKCW